MPVSADGHDGPGDGPRGQVREDLDQDLLGQAVDVDHALGVELVVVRTVEEAVPVVAVALVLTPVVVGLVATEKRLET